MSSALKSNSPKVWLGEFIAARCGKPPCLRNNRSTSLQIARKKKNHMATKLWPKCMAPNGFFVVWTGEKLEFAVSCHQFVSIFQKRSKVFVHNHSPCTNSKFFPNYSNKSRHDNGKKQFRKLAFSCYKLFWCYILYRPLALALKLNILSLAFLIAVGL